MKKILIDIGLIALAGLDIWFNPLTGKPLGIAVAVLGCAALALRRRFPLLVVVLTLPAALVQGALVAPFAALYALAVRSRDRRLLIACVAVSAVIGAIPSPLDEDPGDLAGTLIYFGYTLATSAFPVVLGQLVQTRQELRQRLVEIEDAKEHERVLHAQAILASERAQLAREMHDVVSHQVSLIAVQAGALQVAAGDDRTREAARVIRSLSVGTLDELRTMVTLLRASGDDTTELAPQPTLADLRTLVANSGISVTLSGDLALSVGTPSQRAIYRTVQEALTNVRKHAPGASATVELWQDGNDVGVTVTNTAPSRPSLPLPGARQGLVGLQERAEILHGSFESGPVEGGGFQVRMKLPILADQVG
ncbi:signal transduction histidine kinase [Actinoplanes lutulentus]|uniref:histidine kinase n=1 Tax=Actinoplanes lutulentus TaxID=1287878 RepID=A0A327ZLS8_9ACTN|nr:histidine kinase [Actinoplanes lutulentus]MBB2940725.1 signal transduction histidine kinase [Actinoplanes lutulentus]RAK43036.1 signal transduction histidine kinase [Actinoplanes lutulentus]